MAKTELEIDEPRGGKIKVSLEVPGQWQRHAWEDKTTFVVPDEVKSPIRGGRLVLSAQAMVFSNLNDALNGFEEQAKSDGASVEVLEQDKLGDDTAFRSLQVTYPRNDGLSHPHLVARTIHYKSGKSFVVTCEAHAPDNYPHWPELVACCKTLEVHDNDSNNVLSGMTFNFGD